MSGDDLHRPLNPAFAGFFVPVCLVYFHIAKRDRDDSKAASLNQFQPKNEPFSLDK